MPTGAATDRERADFDAGVAGPGVYRARTAQGTELILSPTVAGEFTGDKLPPDWYVEPWKEGGSYELSERGVVLDGATAGYFGLYGSERSLEFVATFQKRPHQHVGFGTDFRSVPWITFSTKFGHSVYARSNFIIPEDVRLSPSLLGTPHRYRIDWNVLDIEFWVDDKRVAYQLVPMVGYMRPLASNGTLGGPPLEVEWFRMTPYAPEGAFTSRVHDAGGRVRWSGCDLDADVPANTSVTVDVRGGDTPEPDEAWSEWAAAAVEATDGAALRSRFAQYRVRLATAHANRTPVVRAVTLRYSS